MVVVMTCWDELAFAVLVGCGEFEVLVMVMVWARVGRAKRSVPARNANREKRSMFAGRFVRRVESRESQVVGMVKMGRGGLCPRWRRWGLGGCCNVD